MVDGTWVKHLRVSSIPCRHQRTCNCTHMHTHAHQSSVHACACSVRKKIVCGRRKKMIFPKLEYSKRPAEISPRVKAHCIKDRVKCPSWDHPYSHSFLPIIMSYLLGLAQYYLPQQPPSPGSYLSCPLTALLMDKASPLSDAASH